jgi:carboxylesterase type B
MPRVTIFLLAIFILNVKAVLIETDKGSVVGTDSNYTYVWRGIPFAAPPVGDLRWKSPRVISQFLI